MAKLSIKPASESVSLLLFIQDSASTTGGGKTGLAYNTASLTCYYVRPGSAAAAVSLVTQTVTGAWSSGGFVEVDSTNMPGVYRFDIPNAVLAAGVRSAVVMLKGASGMAPLVLEVDLNAEVNVQLWKDSAAPAMTGDAFARLGAPAGASISADIADVPTNAELATALGTADDATLAAIAALNNLSSAQAQTAAAAALTAYDPPTNAEMEARTLPTASYFDPAADIVAHVTLVDTTTTNTDMVAAAPTTAQIKTALEADGSKLDHLWEMTEDDGGIRRLTTNALELAPTGSGSGLDAAGVRAAVGLATANLDTQLGAIVADTGELQADWHDGGRLDLILDAAGSAGDPWITTLPGAYTGNQAGAILDAIRDVTSAIDTSAVTVVASNDAGVLTIIQAVTFGATVSGLTISATWAKLYWTLKENVYDDDSEAIIQIVESNPGVGTDGLLYLDSAAIVLPITVADGVLTVNQAAGTVVIAVSDNATVLLEAASELVWDIKTKDASGATVQNTTGTASIVRAVTQTI